MKRTGQVNHTDVVSRHELDGHVLPLIGRGGITIPSRAASLASGVTRSGAGFAGADNSADEGEQRGKDQDSRRSKHFVVCRSRLENGLIKSAGCQPTAVLTLIAPATHQGRQNEPVETSQRVSVAKERLGFKKRVHCGERTEKSARRCLFGRVHLGPAVFPRSKQCLTGRIQNSQHPRISLRQTIIILSR